MYGNFDAIKDRTKLLKEVNSRRLNRLENNKNSLTEATEKNNFKQISNTNLKLIKEKIRIKIKNQQRKQALYDNLFVLLIGVFLFIIFWIYFYPNLF